MKGTMRGMKNRKGLATTLTRKNFISIRNIAECPRCEAKGKLRLTGGSAKSPTDLKNAEIAASARRSEKRKVWSAYCCKKCLERKTTNLR